MLYIPFLCMISVFYYQLTSINWSYGTFPLSGTLKMLGPLPFSFYIYIFTTVTNVSILWSWVRYYEIKCYPFYPNILNLILGCNAEPLSFQVSLKFNNFMLIENPYYTQSLVTRHRIHTFFLGTLVHILECDYFVYWGTYWQFRLIPPQLIH